jgi:predicted dehydrogenase
VSPGQLRAVVVGCGPRGLEHARALETLETVELVGLAELDPERRERAAAELGLPAYAALEELLSAREPELVVLAVPPAGRTGLALAAAEASSVRGILVEKPLALRLAEAEDLVRGCEERGVTLAVCHQLRFVPAYVALADAVERGEIGDLRLLHAAGFGNLADQGPHLLDAIRWVSGGRRFLWAMSQRGDAAVAGLPSEAVPPGGATHPAPPWMTHHLAVDGGPRAVLESGALYQRGRGEFVDDWLQLRLVAVGSEGIAEAQATGPCRIVNSSGARTLAEPSLDGYFGATGALHAELAEALAEGRTPRSAASEALPSLEALLACAQSAVDGDAAMLPLDAARDPLAELAGAPATAGARKTRRPGATPQLPEISVIVPIPDHRGYLPGCVRGWLEQTLPDESYELIVVSDGAEPEHEEEVRELLRPRDRLLRVEGVHEAALYDAGARAAAGRVVMFTEPHCIPEHRCLDEMLRYLEAGQLDGAVVRSIGICENAMARMEERFYEDAFAEQSQEGHWCKVFLRGVAITRAAYLDAGGFEYAYGRFSEHLLAAELHARGYRIGYAPGSAVRHAYTKSIRQLVPPISDFTRGECSYRADRPGDFCERYFGPGVEWIDRRSLDRRAARSAASAALRNLARRSVWRSPGAARAMLRALRRYAPTALFGPRAAVWRTRLGLWAAKVRCVVWRASESRLYPAFCDAYDRMMRLYRVEHAADHAAEVESVSPAREFSLATLPPERLVGFHPQEMSEGRPFRWSRGVAMLDLPLEPGTCLRIDTLPLRDSPEPLCPWVFVNGRRVTADAVEVEPGALRVSLDPELLDGNASQRITVTCAPLPASMHSEGDSRELGLPVTGVELLPA